MLSCGQLLLALYFGATHRVRQGMNYGLSVDPGDGKCPGNTGVAKPGGRINAMSSWKEE
jgi:hypothetical protein